MRYLILIAAQLILVPLIVAVGLALSVAEWWDERCGCAAVDFGDWEMR